MTTGMQWALLAGSLVGLGIALICARMLRAEPDLADALTRLAPRRPQREAAALTAATSGKERIGLWAIRALPPALWVKTPTRELALLRITPARFYGDKLLFASFGLVTPPLLALFASQVGLGPSLAVPAVASLALAVVLFFVPNYNAIDDARRARREFTRALGAYVILVALERSSGSGVRQAMETAAEIGDSWVFTRLAEELARSRWSGVPPWDALHDLADELGLPSLNEFADTMRLSGEEGASVVPNLHALSASMRNALLSLELGEANAVGERMSAPAALLTLTFLALLIGPSVLTLPTS